MRILITPTSTIPLLSLSFSQAQIVLGFLSTDSDAKHASMSAVGAENVHPGLVRRLFKHLEQNDIDAEIVECEGARFLIDTDTASDFVAQADPHNLKHGVVVVGSLVVDPCRLRLGSGYDLPPDYMRNQLPKYWKFTHDRTFLAQMTPEMARHLTSPKQQRFRGM